jgi:hypothetical protein
MLRRGHAIVLWASGSAKLVARFQGLRFRICRNHNGLMSARLLLSVGGDYRSRQFANAGH